MTPWRGLILVFICCPSGWAQSTSMVAQLISTTGSFNQPVYATYAPGDFQNLFVVERTTSMVKVFNLNTKAVQPAPFVVATNIISSGSEQGLLGLAFHPNYQSNGHFYLFATEPPDGRISVRRYTRSSTNALFASSAHTPVLTFAHDYSNHNGGWLGFGPDGFLYIASGDGGSGNDPNNRAQDVESYMGKILRIDVDRDDYPTDPNRNYGIPSGNPYAGGVSGLDEIWATGLRNPWRCSFDRATGDFWIGDVGQNSREEINFWPAGSPAGPNFGWRVYEGTRSTGFSGGSAGTNYVTPVFEYDRNSGYSVTGGYVYRGNGMPFLKGAYLCGDFGTGVLWSLRPSAGGQFISTRLNNGSGASMTPDQNTFSGRLVSFGEDAAGEIYVVSYAGLIYRVEPADPFLKWRRDQLTTAHLAADTADPYLGDPDKDGLSNLMEYALGSSPSTSNAGPTVLVESNYLTLILTKNSQANNVIHIVQVSTNMVNWTSGAGSTVILQNTATNLKVRDAAPHGTFPRRFIRLMVQTTP
jgi:glucose/arabinose dehydrogenase